MRGIRKELPVDPCMIEKVEAEVEFYAGARQ